MTIPRLPGPLDFLTQGFGAGIQAYDQQRQQQYDQANAGARLILGLLQAGNLDPAVISDPTFQQSLQTAKIPVPPASTIVPSVPAEQARQTFGRLKQVTPGSTEQSLMLDLPTAGQISEADFLQQAAQVRKEVADKYPEVARKLAGVFAPEATAIQEKAATASAAPKEYDYAADNFVALAQGDPKKAHQLALADPQYAELVSSGQLSDEYFARAAREYKLLDENQRIKWADVAARRAAAEREARNFFDTTRKSFDVEIAQLQNEIKQNQLSDLDKLFLPSIQQKITKNQPLNAQEQEILRKTKAVEEASARIDAISSQRQEFRGNFIQSKEPPVPTGNVDPAKVQQVKLSLQRGEITADDVRKSKLVTEEERALILKSINERPTSKNSPKKQ